MKRKERNDRAKKNELLKEGNKERREERRENMRGQERTAAVHKMLLLAKELQ